MSLPPRERARRGGRAVECAGLENRKAERPREFESHPLRQFIFQNCIGLDRDICSCELISAMKRKAFRPVVDETPQSCEPIHGRGASWSPANRFEKLHVDLSDADLVD